MRRNLLALPIEYCTVSTQLFLLLRSHEKLGRTRPPLSSGDLNVHGVGPHIETAPMLAEGQLDFNQIRNEGMRLAG